MKYTNKFKDIVSKFKLVEEDTTTPEQVDSQEQEVNPAKVSKWKAFQVTTDFEGNPIPAKYRPVYIIKHDNNFYDFTNRILPGKSAFSDPVELKNVEQYLSTIPDLTYTAIEADDLLPKLKNVTPPEDIKHRKDDLAVDKKGKSDFIVPDSAIVHKNAVVDTEEMLALADSGIYPELVYHKPKLNFRWIDDEGKKRILAIYGISRIKAEDGSNYILVRDVLPPIHVGKDNEFWKKQEGETYMMPATKVKEIINNDLNKDIVSNIFRVNAEKNDPAVWKQRILDAKAVLDSRFEEWKDKYWLEYDLDKYTEESLKNIYLATAVHTHGFPIKFAIRKYGELKGEKAQEKLKRNFDDWYAAFGQKYKLDRFDDDTLLDIFLGVKKEGLPIEQSILEYGNLEDVTGDPEEIEDEIETESVLTEKRATGEVDDNSKENFIKDPNFLRALLKLRRIDPTYVSNPIAVNYPPVKSLKGDVTNYGEKDKRYILTKVKKPNLFKQYSKEVPLGSDNKTAFDNADLRDIDTFYLKDLNAPRSKPVPFSYNDLQKMLSAPENDDPTPDMWEKAATWKSQHRSLNRGTGYKHVDLADKYVEDALTTIQNNDSDYVDYDLVDMYKKSKQNGVADPIVTHALRSFYKDTSIIVHPNYNNFKNYRYIMDADTGEAMRARYTGSVSQGPYKHLMMSTGK